MIKKFYSNSKGTLIMVDHTKADNLPISIAKLESLSATVEGFEYNYHTDTNGELKGGHAKYRGCNFYVKQGRNGNYYVNFSGSLHNYHAYPGMNSTDFSYGDLQKTVKNLTELVGVPADLWKLKFCEFGVNISVDPTPLLDGLVIHHRNPYYKQRSKGKYFSVSESSQYELKAYDKGKHKADRYNEPFIDQIFRFEVKVKKMEFLNKIEVRTLSDLLAQRIYWGERGLIFLSLSYGNTRYT